MKRDFLISWFLLVTMLQGLMKPNLLTKKQEQSSFGAEMQRHVEPERITVSLAAAETFMKHLLLAHFSPESCFCSWEIQDFPVWLHTSSKLSFPRSEWMFGMFVKCCQNWFPLIKHKCSCCCKACYRCHLQWISSLPHHITKLHPYPQYHLLCQYLLIYFYFRCLNNLNLSMSDWVN